MAAGHLVERRNQVTRATAGRHGGFHTGVDAGEMGREPSAHGVAIDAQAGRIDLGSALQEGESAARGERDEEPVVVPGRIYGIKRVRIRSGAAGEVIDLVALRRMRGIERAPIGVETIVDLPVGQRHLIAAPVERQARIAALCVGYDRCEIGGLSAAMDVHQSRKGFRAFRKSVESRDGRRLAFKDAHAVADDLADDAVDLPRLRHLRFDGFLERVEPRPQFIEVLRHLAVLERR